MRARRATSSCPLGRLWIPAAVSALAGCSLLVEGKLDGLPDDGDGAGGAGGGGTGGSPTASSSSSSSSSSAGSASSSSGLVCPKGFADCDGHSANGCEVNITKDMANCGACKRVCMPHLTCKDGKCE